MRNSNLELTRLVNLTDLYEITNQTSDYLMLPKLGEILSALSVTKLTIYI